jgi:hypothetical protein
MMEAARTSETSVDNYLTRQYISKRNLNFILAAVRTSNLTEKYAVSIFRVHHWSLPEVLKLWGAPRGTPLVPWGGQVD